MWQQVSEVETNRLRDRHVNAAEADDVTLPVAALGLGRQRAGSGAPWRAGQSGGLYIVRALPDDVAGEQVKDDGKIVLVTFEVQRQGRTDLNTHLRGSSLVSTSTRA